MAYPTDLSDSQWQFIKKTLQLDDRKLKHDLRSIWDAIYYLIKMGCQWRMFSFGFPKWQLVYYYYKKWSDSEALDLLLSKLREHVRVKRNQNAEASLGLMDSESIKWGNNRGLNGNNRNKKVKGIKRHVIVDKNGFWIAVMVTVANNAALFLLVLFHSFFVDAILPHENEVIILLKILRHI